MKNKKKDNWSEEELLADITACTAHADALPNEAGSVSVEGHIKIFDPNTKEVFVNKRS